MNAESLLEALAPYGQEHLLRWWNDLDDDARAALAREIDAIDLALVARLAGQIDAPTHKADVSTLEAPDVIETPVSPEARADYNRAREEGHQALARGEVAVMLVAGGQASRLGYDAPKGVYPIGPLTGKSLFQIHAEKMLAVSRRIGRPVPWLIMTSRANDAATRAFFEENAFFGLEKDSVAFFEQGMLPAVDRAGKILLADKGHLALAPDGHGGSLLALRDSGQLDRVRADGAKYVFYFQVDNPLVAIGDPAFVGFHMIEQAEMSFKVVEKTDPAERVGVVVKTARGLEVIEYSDLPEEAAERRDADGRLALRAGSIGIHLLSVDFLDRLLEGDFSLPYHVAHKKIVHVDDAGNVVHPDTPNGYKFETFIFDALPLARKGVIMETIREREFAPVKNATGNDSPDTARALMQNEWRRWIVAAGLADAREIEDRPIEISPLYALDEPEFGQKTRALPTSAGPILFKDL